MRRKVIQSELDQRCGLCKGYICRLEYGRDTVTPERLEVILTCLGVAGLPEEWKAAVEEGHQWRDAPGIRASDLSTEGAQARRARLEAGRSMIEQAQHEGVSLKVVRERELGKFETWRKRVKKT